MTALGCLLSAVLRRSSDRVLAQISYRHLSVDYDDDGFVWDVEMSGPIIGLSVRF